MSICKENIVTLASLFVSEYKQFTDSSFRRSELTLHKLLYLLQRQSYALMNQAFFEDDFEGWVYGPVIPELRGCFENEKINENADTSSLTDIQKYIIDSVIAEYGSLSPSDLIELTHNDLSWQKSRVGLSSRDYGNNIIKKEDIQQDSAGVDFYDPIYDMYLSEMEEIDG